MHRFPLSNRLRLVKLSYNQYNTSCNRFFSTNNISIIDKISRESSNFLEKYFSSSNIVYANTNSSNTNINTPEVIDNLSSSSLSSSSDVIVNEVAVNNSEQGTNF